MENLRISHSYTRVTEKFKGFILPDPPKGIFVNMKLTNPDIGETAGRINGINVILSNEQCDLIYVDINEFPACCGVAMLSHIVVYSPYMSRTERQKVLTEKAKDYFEPLIISIINNFKYSSIVAIRSFEENREWERVLPSFKKMGHEIINKNSGHKLQYYYFTF